MKKAISTNGAPAAIGPYSQAIDCGEFVFTSGQLGLDPATGDESQLMLWVSGMLVCALGAGLMLRRKKEN